MSWACVWACSWVQAGPTLELFACKHRCRHRLGTPKLCWGTEPVASAGPDLQSHGLCGVSVASCVLERMLWLCATPGREPSSMAWDHGTWQEPVLEPALCLVVERPPMWIEYTCFINFKWLFLLLRPHVCIWKLHPIFLRGSFSHCMKIVIVFMGDPTAFS